MDILPASPSYQPSRLQQYIESCPNQEPCDVLRQPLVRSFRRRRNMSHQGDFDCTMVLPMDEETMEPEPEMELEGNANWATRRCNSFDLVDVSYGRIRPLRRAIEQESLPQSSSEILEEIEQEEDETRRRRESFEREAEELREQQEQTLQDLLRLRSEQFRLCTRQMMSLLEVLRDHYVDLDPNSQAAESILDFEHSIRLEVLVMLRNMLRSDPGDIATDTPPELLAQEEDNYEGASESQIASLPRFNISQDNDVQHCSICLCGIHEEDTLCKMQCGHYHHEDCLVKWLQVKNSCPVCRVAIPSDVPDASSSQFAIHEESQIIPEVREGLLSSNNDLL